MNVFLRGTVLRKVLIMTFSSHLACIKNKALQLKDQVQLDEAFNHQEGCCPALPLNWRLCCSLNIQWVLLK